MPRIGDYANAASAICAAGFLVSALLQHYGILDFGYGDEFMTDGFCVGNKDKPMVQSHILCFYGDTVAAAFLAYIAYTHSDMKGFDPIQRGALGVFIHGLAHLNYWFEMQKPEWGQQEMVAGDNRAPLTFAGLWLFYFLLLRSAPNFPQSHALVHGAVQAALLVAFVPQRFAFTWVQMVLMVLPTFYKIMNNPKKDFFYDLDGCLIAGPIAVLAWAEGLACDHGYREIGGHFWCVRDEFFLARRIVRSSVRTVRTTVRCCAACIHHAVGIGTVPCGARSQLARRLLLFATLLPSVWCGRKLFITNQFSVFQSH